MNINKLVRDLTQVTPLSKSEVRKRIMELLTEQRKEVIKMVKTMEEPVYKYKHQGKSFCPQCEDTGYNEALEDIINKL